MLPQLQQDQGKEESIGKKRAKRRRAQVVLGALDYVPLIKTIRCCGLFLNRVICIAAHAWVGFSRVLSVGARLVRLCVCSP